jgi:valyl-tRNA synthetase
MPFVTEELWLEIVNVRGMKSDTLMLERFPEAADFPTDTEADDEISWLKGFIVGTRQIRGEANLSRSAPLKVSLADAEPLDRERVERHAAQLKKLGGIEGFEFLPPGAHVKGAATALLGGMRILVPLAGLIDVAAERDRLGKQLARTSDERDKARRKLANENFVANAPEDVVGKERSRVAELTQRAEQLERQIERLADLE